MTNAMYAGYITYPISFEETNDGVKIQRKRYLNVNLLTLSLFVGTVWTMRGIRSRAEVGAEGGAGAGVQCLMKTLMFDII